MSSYADDERDGDFVRCDVCGDEARMHPGWPLLAPAAWLTRVVRRTDGRCFWTTSRHVCHACVDDRIDWTSAWWRVARPANTPSLPRWLARKAWRRHDRAWSHWERAYGRPDFAAP